MSDATFDGANLHITLPSTGSFDVEKNFYSAWKEWVLVEENSRWEKSLDIIGGEPTVTGQFLDATYFLVNGWKIKPWSGQYTLYIEGNIYDRDGENVIVSADGDSNNININTNTSTIVRRVETSSGGTGSIVDTIVLEYGDIIYICLLYTSDAADE